MNLQEREEAEDLTKTVGKTLNNYLKSQCYNKRVNLNPSHLNFKSSKIRYYAFRKYPILINPCSLPAREFLQKWILKRKQTIWRRLSRLAIQITYGRFLCIFPSLTIETEKEAISYLKDTIMIASRFIKLIDFREMTVTSILKNSVNKSYLEDEVKVRKVLCDSPYIPRLIEYNDKGNFYKEEFFDGIPLSHHTIPKHEKIRVLKESVKLLSIFYKRMGHKEVNPNEYMAKREDSIRKSLEKIGNSYQSEKFLGLVKKLFKVSKNIPSSSAVTLVYSPGDRKLEQILYNPNNKQFKMIDWESLSPLISITHDVFQLLEGLFGKKEILQLIKTGEAEQELMDSYQYSLDVLNLKDINSQSAYRIYFIERIDGNFGWISSNSWKSESVEKIIIRWTQRIQRYLSFLSIC